MHSSEEYESWDNAVPSNEIGIRQSVGAQWSIVWKKWREREKRRSTIIHYAFIDIHLNTGVGRPRLTRSPFIPAFYNAILEKNAAHRRNAVRNYGVYYCITNALNIP